VFSSVITEVSEQIRLDDGTRNTSMALSPDSTWCVVGDALGNLRKVDLRTGNVFGRFRGISGSIRGVAFHPSLPVIAQVGLDRFARVFDTKTMRPVCQVYMKQRLNCVLFDAEEKIAPPVPVPHGGEPDEEDEDWLGIAGADGKEHQKDKEAQREKDAKEKDLTSSEKAEAALSRKTTHIAKKRKLATSKKASIKKSPVSKGKKKK